MVVKQCCKQKHRLRCFRVARILWMTATLVPTEQSVFVCVTFLQVVSLELSSAELPIPISEVVLRTGAVPSKREAKRIVEGISKFTYTQRFLCAVGCIIRYNQVEAWFGLAKLSRTHIVKLLWLTSRMGLVYFEWERKGRLWFG